MTAPTPLRSDEVQRLPRPDSSSAPYAAHLMSLVESVGDASSWSDELALAAPTWPDSYHLHPARANVLRTLPLPPGAAVLELGARAGALTRYLGETAALVDALELDPAMAAVAAVRCEDLPTVQVRTGWIDDVPVAGVYDLIVAVDAVEDIHDHGMTIESFLQRCRDLLAPGGIVVLAADNERGVRRLVGDIAPRVPDGSDRRATPVDSTELGHAARRAGLESMTLSAFPDHRFTQTLFAPDRLADLAPALLTDLPKFESTRIAPPHIDPGAEKRAWETLAARGDADGHANSSVLLAGETRPATDDAAVFWSVGRTAGQSACNYVRREDGAPVVVRTHTFPDAPRVDGRLRLHPHTEPIVDGVPLDRVLATESDLARARDLLVAWAALVDDMVDGQEVVPWDLIPRNILLRADGSMAAVDQEWVIDGASADVVRSRGFFWLATDILAAPARPAWAMGHNAAALADFLRRLTGEASDPFWLTAFIDREAEDAAFVAPSGPGQTRSFHARKNRGALMSISQSRGREQHVVDHDEAPDSPAVAAMREVLASLSEENEQLREQITDLEMKRRHVALVHRDHVLGITSELETLRERMTSSQLQLRRSREKATALQTSVKDMRASATWRLGRLLLAPLSRLRGSSSR